jgi:hypothetical protein
MATGRPSPADRKRIVMGSTAGTAKARKVPSIGAYVAAAPAVNPPSTNATNI